WSDDLIPPMGRVVASVGPEPTPLSFGVVCSGVGSIPAVKGELARGFSDVFVHDGLLDGQQCGGPVVDATGKVVALNITTQILDDPRAYAIPGARRRRQDDLPLGRGLAGPSCGSRDIKDVVNHVSSRKINRPGVRSARRCGQFARACCTSGRSRSLAWMDFFK